MSGAAAKSGLHHWLWQRISAAALAPLSVWFVWHATWLFSVDYGAAREFLARPLNATLMTVFAVTLLYHSYLGLQVIVEDYVADEAKRLTTLVGFQGIHWLLAILAVSAVLKVAL